LTGDEILDCFVDHAVHMSRERGIVGVTLAADLNFAIPQ